jgi:hypothetical protein
MSQIQATVDEQKRRAVIKTYSNAKKLFQVADSPIGVMMYGIGNIGQRSIEGLMLDFSANHLPTLPDEQRQSVKGIADALFEFFNSLYQPEFKDIPKEQKVRDFRLGLFIAGYSKDKPFVEEWEFLLPQDKQTKQVRPETTFGASWRGVDVPCTRLLKGFDPRSEGKLKEHGVPDDVIKEALQSWGVKIAYAGMPVQDAINFAAFIVKTTIGLVTFEIGQPSCGGPLQIACILPARGFQWITQSQLYVERD